MHMILREWADAHQAALAQPVDPWRARTTQVEIIIFIGALIHHNRKRSKVLAVRGNAQRLPSPRREWDALSADTHWESSCSR
jgi:hypothetical protein